MGHDGSRSHGTLLVAVVRNVEKIIYKYIFLFVCLFVCLFVFLKLMSMLFSYFKKTKTKRLVGMPAESSLAICSMIFGGVFERYPKLKV